MNTLYRTLPPAILAASLIAIAGCGRSASVPAAEAASVSNPLEISLTPNLRERVAVGEPEFRAISETLRAAGRVQADETRMARVSAPVTGRIIELEAMEGQWVKQGQVLATIFSTELSAAQSGCLKALTQLQLSERAVERAKLLLDAGVIGSAELQRREGELQQASADLAAAREQLRVLGLNREAISNLETSRRVNSVTHILSSIDGMILERRATIGQIVQAVEPVFVVADLSNVWLVADVPEQSAASLILGKRVEAEIPALPDLRIRGELSFVSSIVDPETRTIRTRMNLPNPHRRFKPSMLATMSLMDGAEPRLVVPASAVVREGNADHVFVQSGPETFVLRRVTVGEEFGDSRVLLEGLRAGERIITDGAFHLNNERKRLALGGSEA